MSSTPSTQSRGNLFERFTLWLDRFQQKHRVLGFPLAVIKKYGDDDAGHQAALITYYGFLSLFPLLLVATSVIDLISWQNDELRTRLLADINTYLPIIGDQLQANVHSTRTGAALVIGLIAAFYGTRGIANAVRTALDYAWEVPKAKRSNFVNGAVKSFSLLLGAGLGLVFTAALAGYATSALGGHSTLLRIVPILINIALLYLIFMYVFLVGPSRKRSRAEVRLGAILASVGLLVLQTVGGYLITHQLHNLRGLYGQFALVLVVMFWLYLQAQVLVYAIEINVVQAYKLWPRSTTSKPLTAADEKAYRLYAERQAYRPKSEETIEVSFHTENK
ncbi:MAG TPA: YihY/virulence factor BrkB family protein [Candidatus Saccharimonadales bacterium]|nr:YihY/virulence factor BrkB family protein [Candidatus Saccharimonadales bacterium]